MMGEVHTIMQVPVYDKGRLHGYTDVWHDDFQDVMSYLWKVNPGGYPCRYSKAEGTVRMSRHIMGLATGDPREVDHIDHNLLNHCRSNLRVVTHAQNQQNRKAEGNRNSKSKYRGVSPCKQTGKWMATCVLSGTRHWLGRHATEEEAAQVVREFRLRHMTHNDADWVHEPADLHQP
jgi:hypothetical protein